MRRVCALLTVSLLGLTACGGGSDDATNAAPSSEAPTDTEPPPESAAPVETEPAADTTVAPPSAPDGAVSVGLVEWAIETDLEVTAGTVTFDVSNNGDFPHHFAIARGNSYEELPQSGGGAIDEVALGDDFIGRTVNLRSGQSEIIEFDLDPGNYVFFCNIAGSVSHAAQGQVLAVTVG